MIKTEDFLREFPIQRRTDRDCEIPLLIEYIQRISPIASLLDIGSHDSANPDKYGQEIRKFIARYDGIDVMPDEEAKKVLDSYIVNNANEYFYNQYNLYDVVICVSTIEHAGVSTYKKDDIKKEQNDLFETCLKITKKHMWISFPVGQEYVYPNELSIITEKQLKRWETITSNFKVKERFMYNQGAQASHPWHEHSNRKAALSVPYMDFIGTQSLTVLEIDKT